MKTMYLVLICCTLSLAVMLVIDYALGAKAEFLNAFSVLQRLLGQQPTFGDSEIMKKWGASGEFGAVILANLMIGSILTFMIRSLK